MYSVIGVDSEHAIVVNERGDRAVRVDLQIVGLVLIELQQIEIVTLILDAFLGEGEHGFAGVRIRLPVVQGQHGRLRVNIIACASA
jgi:hypothetical protein